VVIARQKDFDIIHDRLTWLSTKVMSSNKLGLTDINNHGEDFYRDFLNLILGWELENLNDVLEANFPAIDLGDTNQRIAIQVTSTANLRKAKYTVKKFVEKKLHEQYDRLVILRIGNSIKHKAEKIGETQNYKLIVKDDIWDIHTILKDIKSRNVSDIRKIREFIEQEIPIASPLNIAPIESNNITDSNVIDEAIKGELDELKKVRFFAGSSPHQRAAHFADRLTKGDLQNGKQEIKETATLWCARILSAQNLEYAQQLLAQCQSKDQTEEYKIAEAFTTKYSDVNVKVLHKLKDQNSPLANTAKLFLTSIETNPKETVEWVNQCGFKASDFDTDGKFKLLHLCLEAGEWELAQNNLVQVTEDDLQICPVLYFIRAMINLLQTIPTPYRSQVFQNVPFHLSSFPIQTTQKDQQLLRNASENFKQCEKVALEFDLEKAAHIAGDFALWIDLRNPETQQATLERLATLSASNDALRYANFAIQFGLQIDDSRLEQQIEQQTAREGGISPEAAIARFALITRQKSRAEAIEYLSRHKDDLQKFINVSALATTEIDLLCQEGRVVEAQSVLDQLKREGDTFEILAVAQRMIDSVTQDDPVGARIQEYQDKKTPDSLNNLTIFLEEQTNWILLAKYARELHSQFGTVDSLQRLALALHNLGQEQELLSVLNENLDFVEQSIFLKKLEAEALYSTGELMKSWAVVTELLVKNSTKSVRELAIHIAITSGNWNWLVELIENEWKERQNRNASELIRIAQLAHAISSNRARDFIVEATSKADGDAEVFASAYFIASSEGWEDDNVAKGFLPIAIQNSGESGPLQRMSLEELMDQGPDWRDHQNSTWDNIKQAKIPMFAGARQLNRSLCEMQLIQALANQDESDVRKKSIIRAYSPKIQSREISAQNVGLDATALLTFGLLGKLGKLQEAFQTIYIPHSTMFWLLNEKQRVTFHQPSRLKRARTLSDLLNSQKLYRFIPPDSSQSDLIPDVGKDFAAFLSTAQQRNSKETPHVVIRPSVVHRIGSLMNDPVNLSAYEDELHSCSDVIRYLNATGHLTEQQSQNAYTFLTSQNDAGLSEAEIQSGSVLYLDDVAVSYFQTLGILRKLKDAGLEPYISSSQLSEMESLLRYQQFSERALTIIENLRNFLAAGIESGKVQVGPSPHNVEEELDEFRSHPSISILDIASSVDAIVADDPFLNQHPIITVNGVSKPIVSSWDVFEYLTSNDAITELELDEVRYTLRKSGYIAISPSFQELSRLINKTTIADGEIIETAELRTIKNNLMQMQIFSALNLPEDAVFVVKMHKNIRDIVTQQWNSKTSIEIVRARSDWLVEQIGFRYWARCYPFDAGTHLASIGPEITAQALMSSFQIAEEDRKIEYNKWLEDSIIQPIRISDPKLYDRMMASIERGLIDANSKPLEELYDAE